MNIGIVTTWFERGAGYVSKSIMEVLKKEHNVLIYARGGEEKRTEGWNQDFVTFGKEVFSPIPTTIDKRDFINWLTGNKIDLVIFNEQRNFIPLKWCNELGIKTGAYIDYYTMDTIKYFRCYDFLICNTERHYNLFKQHHPNVHYIKWGTNINLFNNESKKINKNVTFFHSSGYSPYRKGTDLFLSAISRLDENLLQKSKFIIHTQVPLEDFISKELIKIINNNKYNIEVIQKTVSAPGLYYLGDVYVYPCRLDGLGLTVVEALASGLPVIIPDSAPMKEFVTDEISRKIDINLMYARNDGYFWPMHDINIDDLVTNLQYYIQKVNLEENQRLTRNYAVKNLDWDKNSISLLQVIKNIKFYDKSSELEQMEKYEYNRLPLQRFPKILSIFTRIYRLIKTKRLA